MPLPEAIIKSAYDKQNIPSESLPIPTNLQDALKAFLEDKVITDALGDDFVRVFTAAKTHEIKVVEESTACLTATDGDYDNEFMQKLYFEYF